MRQVQRQTTTKWEIQTDGKGETKKKQEKWKEMLSHRARGVAPAVEGDDPEVIGREQWCRTQPTRTIVRVARRGLPKGRHGRGRGGRRGM